MFDLPGPLGTLANFLVIVLGFGFIVFIHELGHFVAAKWAGIRVLAFSIGFGQIMGSYRKGIGFRRGSSEPEYLQLLKDAKGEAGEKRERARTLLTGTVSPTEYRLSMLPLGGYVKMLGQEDLNPGAVSAAPDSYQNRPVGKRMVVISAGVVMNVISAAILFIIVFMAGIRVLPAQAGYVPQNSPAASAAAINHPEIKNGLERGDRIVSINGKPMRSYEDIVVEIAMAPSTIPAKIVVERSGIAGFIEFEVQPIKGERTGLLDLGIAPAMSPRLITPKKMSDWERASRGYGLGGLMPGDEFVTANNQPINSPFDLLDIAQESDGRAITTSVARGDRTIEHVLTPVPAMQVDPVRVGDEIQGVRHLLGLTGVMMVTPYASQKVTKQGLKPGDIFARIGTLAYPSAPEGIAIVKAMSGKPLDLVVLRADESGTLRRINLTVEVSKAGTIGFYPTTTTTHTNLVAMPPMFSIEAESSTTQGSAASDDQESKTRLVSFPGSDLIEHPGSRIISVGETDIGTLRDLPKALLGSTHDAYSAGAESFIVPVTLELPLPVQPDGSVPTTTTQWTLTRADIDTVAELGWMLEGSIAMVEMFEYAQIIDKADGPVHAVELGFNRSRRVMLQTYITFLRLFQGSVEVKHLKGPVGIAHIGTQIASQGWVWVLFFMALISINLAVINFLPLPIVDGGQFLMLVYEWIRGKPVPIVVQNAATMAGLLMIGTIFLYVTFNDVKAIFGA